MSLKFGGYSRFVYLCGGFDIGMIENSIPL